MAKKAAKKVQPQNYTLLWRNKWLTSDAETIKDMINSLRAAADELADMAKAGVKLVPDGGTADDYASLTTTDAAVAKKYDFEKEEVESDEDGVPLN